MAEHGRIPEAVVRAYDDRTDGVPTMFPPPAGSPVPGRDRYADALAVSPRIDVTGLFRQPGSG